jgi:hypothetical protein
MGSLNDWLLNSDSPLAGIVGGILLTIAMLSGGKGM